MGDDATSTSGNTDAVRALFDADPAELARHGAAAWAMSLAASHMPAEDLTLFLIDAVRSGRTHAANPGRHGMTMIKLSADEEAVREEVRVVTREGREISDACARVIASWCTEGTSTAAMSFTSTGTILIEDEDTGPLWRELGGRERAAQPEWRKDALDCLGTYLVRRAVAGETGAVAGWSGLWVR